MHTKFKQSFAFCILLLLMLPSLAQSPNSQLQFSFFSGASMGRWMYDKGLSDPVDGFHQGYDRTHLAPYVPIGLQVSYRWKKWTIGAAASISWLGDDELISSTTRIIVPREYFITDGSDIRFSNYMLFLERTLIDRSRYKLKAAIFTGSFRSVQDHPRKDLFTGRYILDLGLTNEIYVSENWFILIRPVYKRKHIGTKDSPFIGESHEIISFGIDYGFGFNIF
ncbi:MAG: hypothetical protein AAF696_20025 [Bacteroidota bacterium]